MDSYDTPVLIKDEMFHFLQNLNWIFDVNPIEFWNTHLCRPEFIVELIRCYVIKKNLMLDFESFTPDYNLFLLLKRASEIENTIRCIKKFIKRGDEEPIVIGQKVYFSDLPRLIKSFIEARVVSVQHPLKGYGERLVNLDKFHRIEQIVDRDLALLRREQQVLAN